MTKQALTSYVLLHFDKVMRFDNYKLFKDEIIQIKEKNEDQDVNKLAKEINDSPEFEIMQKYFLRTTLKNIESQLKTIKVIILICFIVGILAALFSIGGI
ncbi:MAG: hypothetical protein HN778_03030 [Prolixibacteraceae bacterium]|jgi:hypothetical protein|nr:hypothetical protein [Prolixibacteraceae bacterium]MBT6007157.1 hypothetical protein [Prolixibacteraceae bacterium]MBT6764553.1 hypothetical protein [Prolixibacteraceae bacterium]MBT6996810.1 hypothetical protein [Prolixibacteraceae bacterium]MBT7393786.1 hypothetical protein [Prolixibacteraceae bacterium]